MTIPLLMNCPHKEDAICLKCAKIEYDRYQEIITNLKAKSQYPCHHLADIQCCEREGECIGPANCDQYKLEIPGDPPKNT